MKTQLLKKWEISMLLALCITLCAGVWASARSAALSGSLVRLHVVAVSDDAEEQAIKLRVRDSVLAYLEPRLEGVQDAAGARELIGSELDGIRSAAETAAARGWVDTLDIKTPGLGAAVDTLSGGNQQKVVIAKWLDTAPQILILNEPTRGVDVGAKVEIYNTLELMCKKKIGVIMISSELPEIMAIADRIIVIHEGRYMGECLKQDISQERLLSMAIGG